jgi:hypothetical protein
MNHKRLPEYSNAELKQKEKTSKLLLYLLLGAMMLLIITFVVNIIYKWDSTSLIILLCEIPIYINLKKNLNAIRAEINSRKLFRN